MSPCVHLFSIVLAFFLCKLLANIDLYDSHIYIDMFVYVCVCIHIHVYVYVRVYICVYFYMIMKMVLTHMDESSHTKESHYS